MLTVVCVRWGNKFDKSYVNIMHERVKAHMDTPFKFVCVSDDDGYDEGIEVVRLPDGLEGWWGKLWLFSDTFQGMCTDRILYIDLDTIVTGHLDDIAAYDGDFIILQDFYRPNGYGSGLMAWRKGFGTDIWSKWCYEGQPRVDGGDQAWIERCVKDADLWQDFFPGRVVSYKVHAESGIPNGADVVCFHGKPMPHEIRTGWVTQFFKSGGLVRVKIKDKTFIPPDEMLENVKINCQRLLPQFTCLGEPNTSTVVIVGGAPSLAENIDKIRDRKRRGQIIWAVNGAAKFLMEHGIKPDVHAIMDSRPENIAFVKDAPAGVEYMINAMCHPSIFDALEGRNVTMWHSHIDPVEEHHRILRERGHDNPAVMQGGSTIALNSMYIAFYLGFRRIHLYGVDSSYTDGRHHAYDQQWNDKSGVFMTPYGGREYATAAWMVNQVYNFKDMWRQLVERGCTVTAHGNGLLPDVCRDLNEQFRRKLKEVLHDGKLLQNG